MLFNSLVFGAFLAIVLPLYYALALRGQNLLLLVAGLVFYGAWDWRFLLLLLFSTFIDWAMGLAIDKQPVGDPRRKRWLHEHIMLLRKGGHPISSESIKNFRRLFSQNPNSAPAEQVVAPPEAIVRQLTVYRGCTHDNDQFAAVAALRKSAEAQGIKVLFANMPIEPSAKVGAAWDYSVYLAELATLAQGAPLLDLDAIAQPSDFGDAVHPSPSGTARLRSAVHAFVQAQLHSATS